ncbi:MAG TPA: hypothetical protein VM557_11520 [Thermoanaerobaculia bacterium]|nr:hypothetical protein [Thermoanaerobaculia bacterium]
MLSGQTAASRRRSRKGALNGDAENEEIQESHEDHAEIPGREEREENEGKKADREGPRRSRQAESREEEEEEVPGSPLDREKNFEPQGNGEEVDCATLRREEDFGSGREKISQQEACGEEEVRGAQNDIGCWQGANGDQQGTLESRNRWLFGEGQQWLDSFPISSDGFEERDE